MTLNFSRHLTTALLPFAALLASQATVASTAEFSLVTPVCRAATLEEAAACERNDQILFLPAKANRRLVLEATKYCDLHHAVVWNDAGLSCIAAGARRVLKRKAASVETSAP